MSIQYTLLQNTCAIKTRSYKSDKEDNGYSSWRQRYAAKGVYYNVFNKYLYDRLDNPPMTFKCM